MSLEARIKTWTLLRSQLDENDKVLLERHANLNGRYFGEVFMLGVLIGGFGTAAFLVGNGMLAIISTVVAIVLFLAVVFRLMPRYRTEMRFWFQEYFEIEPDENTSQIDMDASEE